MANEQNLKSWRPGQSGNPAGKPKGTKHLSTWIHELMEDESLTQKATAGKLSQPPVQAIVSALIVRAINGDMKAFELLASYGYGTKMDLTSANSPLPIPILASLSIDHTSDLSPFEPTVS